jgi:GNAT superfamily N-acetyltransferase
MSTDPTYRRRGYGRATLAALLGWLRSTGITTVDLHATPDGEPLYRSLGFTEPTDRALTLRFR